MGAYSFVEKTMSSIVPIEQPGELINTTFYHGQKAMESPEKNDDEE